MSATNPEKLQQNNQTSLVIEMQTTLLEQWCDAHGWTELHTNSDYRFSAFPPGNLFSFPLPESALTQLKKIEDIFEELEKLQARKRLTKETTKGVLLSSVGCALVISTHEEIQSPIDTLSQTASVYIMNDYSTILFLMIPVTLGSIALFSWQKYHQLKLKIATEIVSLKNIVKAR